MYSVKKILIASVAAVALCTPVLCSAMAVSGVGSDSGSLITALKPSAGQTLPQLSQDAADAALWNLVSASATRSQNAAWPFEALSGGLATSLTPLVVSPVAAPSPEPLSGATWLFVLGVLGLAGSRLTTPRGEKPGRRVSARPAPTDPGLATSGYSMPW
jgi:hypothetical protein